MRRFTENDKKFLKAIDEYHTVHGYMPSYSEIGELVGLTSKATIHAHMDKLFDFGYLETDIDDDGCRYPRAFRLGKKYEEIRLHESH